MSTLGVGRGAKQKSKKAAAADRERKERDNTQQQRSAATQPSTEAASSPSIEELRASLSATPELAGYLITDHQATTLAVSTRTRQQNSDCIRAGCMCRACH